MFMVAFALLIGMGLSFQTAVNSRLRGFIGSPFLASTVSFIVGTLFLALITLFSGQDFFIPWPMIENAPLWLWIGGLLGVVVLTTNILLFPYLGGVQTAVIPLLGQILMGLMIDHFGWFYAPEHPLSLLRILGAALVLAAIFITVVLPSLKKAGGQARPSPHIWLWRALGMVAGMLTSVQTAVNGELGRELHSPIHAALVSFLVGSVTLFLFTAFKEGRLSRLKQGFGKDRPRWLWIGGILGAMYVFGSALLAPLIGTGQTVIFALTGLILGSLLVDHFGLFGAMKKPIQSIQCLGLALLMGGVMLIRFF